MAQLALTAAGMAIGSYFGNQQLGAAAGAIAGAGLNWLLTPGVGKPHIHDKEIQVSAYGQRIPKVYGTCRIAGVLGWNGGLIPHKTSVDAGGGKGLSQSATTYTYTASFQIILCEGPIAGFGRVWFDGKLIHDYRAGAYNSPSWLRGCDIAGYHGTEDQMPDPTIAAAGAPQGGAPAYRGVAYIVVNNLQLADFANRIPNVTVEVIQSGTGATPTIEVTSPVSVGVDSMLYDGDRGWVYNYDAGAITKIDASSGTLARTASGLGVSIFAAAIGSDGFIYGGGFSFLPGGHFNALYRVDPNALQVVEQVGVDAVWSGAVPGFSQVIAANGFIVAWEQPGGVAGPNLSLFTEPGGIFSFELAASLNSANGDAPPFNFDWAALDDDGNLWATARDGSNHPHLYQYVLEITDAAGFGPLFSQITQAGLTSLLGDLGTAVTTGSVGTGGGLAILGAFAALQLDGFTVSLSLQNDYDLSGSLTDTGGWVGVAPDPNDGLLLIGRGESFIKFDPSAGVVAKPQINVGVTVGPDGDGMRTSWMQGVVDGKFYAGGASPVTVFDCGGWIVDETVNLDAATGGTAHSSLCDPNEGSIWTMNWGTYNIFEVFTDRIAPDTVPLSSIVADICSRAGLSSGQYDVSALTAISVAGFVDTRAGASGRDLLQPLMTAYFFDAAEIGWLLAFVPRGSAPIAALTSDDIGGYQGGNNRPEPLQMTIPFESELPVRVWVHHIDPDIDYQTNVQPSKRVVRATLLEAMKEQSVELPIVLTADQAGVIADTILYIAWTVRQFAFATSRAWLALDPTDVITLQVTYPDTSQSPIFTVRLTQDDLGANGVIQWQAEAEDPSLYVASEQAGGGPSGWTPPIAQPLSPTLVNFMDIVALRDQDANQPGYYIAAGPLKDSPAVWNGCLILKSLDGGQSFQNFETIANESIQGVATTALAAPRAWTTWDRVNTVTVLPNAGGEELASASEEQVLNGANVAILGNEVIQFADVTENADGTYTLATLLRGRRGSDPFVGTHAIGDRFVVISAAATMRVSEDSSQLDLARVYDAVSIGEASPPETPFSFTDTGQSLMPLTACSIEGSRDGSETLTITWLRQTRIGGENDWQDGVTDVPLGEAAESYQIDVLKAGAVVRTLAADSETAAYSAADQTTDFGSPQSALAIVIYQMSAVVGRGFGEAATV